MGIKKIHIVFVVAGVLLLCISGNLRADSGDPLPTALQALESDDEVTVTKERLPRTLFNRCYYLFEPADVQPTKAFIFYPGGAVDPRAYAPPARAIAAEGFLTFIVCMPNDLAIFGQKRANRVMSGYEDITTWAIGGHSLGGVGASGYTQEFDDKVAGIVLWASFPSETFRIDDKDVKAMSIYGTNDGLSTVEEIEDSEQHLPPDTQFVAIEGGNHTYFGWYEGFQGGELQEGDNPADITREEQQEQVVQATVDFLNEL